MHPFYQILSLTACCFIALSFSGCETENQCEESSMPTTIQTASLVHFDTDMDAATNGYALCGNRQPRFDNRFSPYKGGSVSVDVVVEHYSFLGCPHCARFAAYVEDLLSRYPDMEQHVRFYFHHYTFTGYEHYHAAAFAASQESMELFWQFHDILLSTTGVEYSFQQLRDVAMYDLSLDMTAYDAAVNNITADGARTYAFLEEEKKIAKANCVYGTPSVYICGEFIEDWRNSEDVILQYLQGRNE